MTAKAAFLTALSRTDHPRRDTLRRELATLQRQFPEIDRAGWFSPGEAREKLVPAQIAFLDRLLEAL